MSEFRAFKRERKFIFSSRLILITLWLLGLFCGIWVGLQTGDHFLSRMHSLPHGAVSIVSLFCTVLFPFLIVISAAAFDVRGLIFPVAFLKAFGFSYISAGILWAFPAGGWLVRFLMMFSATLTCPALFFIMYHCLSADTHRSRFWGLPAVLYASLIAAIDYFEVIPLLAEIMIFPKG